MLNNSFKAGLSGCVTTFVLLFAVLPAAADDLFRVDVVGTSDTRSVSGNSLFDLARDVAGFFGRII